MFYVCATGVMDVVFSVCIVRRGAVGARVLYGHEMGSVSVSLCRCCMFVSCVHPVAVINAAFCMTCSFLMFVEDARDDHMEEAYKQKTQHPSHPLHKHTTYFNTPRLKKTLFLTTAATQQTFPQTPTQSLQQT